MSPQLQVVIFTIASAGIVWVSRSALLDFRSHGFYRFFAWEAILALILLNLERWFYRPFSLHQLLSWPLLLASLFLVLDGVRLLRLVGQPDDARDDPSLIGIEKTTTLVTVGAYRYIRHPLYSSLLFLAWGTFFKQPSWVGVFLALTATVFLTLTARVEEAENLLFFGAAYQGYMKQTKMFIPFLF